MANLRKRKLAVAIALCFGAGLGVATRPARAQVQQQAPQDEIIVTGSLIGRAADRPQPVTVLDNEDLRLEQRGSIAEVFKNLPQNVGSVSTVNTQQGGGSVNMGNSPTTTLNLRGLGARATLVLLNGGRQTSDGGFGFVDINNLAPSIMIERIELLTDGASALYGSDAVAGVANFITRNAFDGIELRVETQKIADSPADQPDVNLGLIFGSQGEQTNVVAGFDYATTEVMLVEDRYDDARLRLGLTSPSGNPATFAPRVAASGARAPTAQWRPDPLCGSEAIGGGLAAGELVTTPNPQCNLFNALGRDQQPESQRLIGLSVLTHDLSDTITAQVEVGFARTRYDIPFGYVTPAGFGTNFPFIPIDNPGAAAIIAQDPAFGGPTAGTGGGPINGYFFQGRVLSPAGDRINIHTSEQDTYRLAARLDGQFGGAEDSAWGWQAAFTSSWNDTRFSSVDTLLARANLSADGYGGPNCRFARVAEPGRAADPTGAQRGVVSGASECLWWNPFASSLLASPGEATYNDPAIFDWITGNRESNDSGELNTLDFIVTGDLWEMGGGATGLAVGVHRRDQSFSQEWDTISKQTGLWGFNGAAALLDFSGDRTTDAFFVELAMFPTETVEIQLAGRHEDTGDLDSSDPKVGVLWTPTDRLFIRASAGTSFRQPGEIQMFGRGPGGATTDPVGGQAIQARGFITGNLGLLPETSENWTTGVTWNATDRFTVELNYWNVTFEDIINQETASAIWLQDRADGFITDPRIVLAAGAPNEVCEVTGRWNGQATTPLPAGCLTGVNVVLFNTTYVNQAFQETSGVDYNFSYDWEAIGSEWTARLLGSWTDTYDMMVGNQIIDGVGGYNTATFGSPNPEFRTNLMVDWLRGSHRARVTWRHLSKLHLTPAETTAASRLTEQKDFLTVDALYNYALPNGRSDVSLSVTNLLDKDDPLRHGAQTTSTGGIYEVRGRVFRLGLNWAF